MRFLVTLCLMFLFVNVVASSASGAGSSKPVLGCAPATPSPVPGPLATPPTTPGTLFINEVLLIAHATWDCSQHGKPSPSVNDAWVEIYNARPQAFDLSAVHAGLDIGPGSTPYTFPAQTAIAPAGLIVVFPCKNALFRLTSGSTLRLIVSGTVIDQVQLTTMSPDQSYARTSDGAPTWQLNTHPTIDASNSSTAATPTPRSGTSTPTSSGSGSGTTGTGGSGTVQGSGATSGVGTNRGTLQLPNAATPSPLPMARSPAQTGSTRTQADASFNLPRAILLTMLVIAALFALFWCWRRFGVP